MSRVLRCAAQYVHVPVKEIDGALGSIYSRSAIVADLDLKEDAVVSPELWKLWNSGYIPTQLFDAKKTIDFFNRKFGALCPICYATSDPSCHHKSGKITRQVSPLFLRLSSNKYFSSMEWGRDEDDDGVRDWDHGSICFPCCESLRRYVDIDKEDIVLGLPSLIKLTSFKLRLKDNKYRRLRFQPRATWDQICQKTKSPSASDLLLSNGLKQTRRHLLWRKPRALRYLK